MPIRDFDEFGNTQVSSYIPTVPATKLSRIAAHIQGSTFCTGGHPSQRSAATEPSSLNLQVVPSSLRRPPPNCVGSQAYVLHRHQLARKHGGRSGNGNGGSFQKSSTVHSRVGREYPLSRTNLGYSSNISCHNAHDWEWRGARVKAFSKDVQRRGERSKFLASMMLIDGIMTPFALCSGGVSRYVQHLLPSSGKQGLAGKVKACIFLVNLNLAFLWGGS